MTERLFEIKFLVREIRQEFEEPEESTDPFRLSEALGVHVRFFPLGTVKGFYTVLNHIPFIALNSGLTDEQAKVVCAHELGHHFLHQQFTGTKFFNEYELYQMENHTEAEANLFAAFLLLPDSAVSFLQQPENRGLSLREAAGQFSTTEELFAIRMSAEGLPVPDVRFSTFPG